MSNNVNTRLIEEAVDMIDYFTSHPAGLDKQLKEALDAKDLDKLYELVRVGRLEQFRLEYEPEEY